MLKQSQLQSRQLTKGTEDKTQPSQIPRLLTEVSTHGNQWGSQIILTMIPQYSTSEVCQFSIS